MSTIWVPGIPAPGGSKRGIARGVMVDDCKRNPDWRAAVAWMAAEQFKTPLTGALKVRFEFRFPRPKFHYGKRGLKPSAPQFHIVKPDATKLVRSTEDAMTGIVWRDDAQIVEQEAVKVYTEGTPGCTIIVLAAAELARIAEGRDAE